MDAELNAIAALVSAADKLPYFNGSGAAALANFSAFVRTLTGSANGLALRTGVGSVHGKAANVVTDFGADPTGAVNATTAIQAALDAVTSGAYRGVYFPAGLYTVTPGTLTAFTSKGASFVCGDGGPTDGNPTPYLGSVIQSDGTSAGKPLLTIDGANGIHIRDMAFWGNSTSAINANNCIGVRWVSRAGDGVGAGGGTFDRVAFLWCSIGADIGYWDGVDPAFDASNCDTFVFNLCLWWKNSKGLKSNQDQNVVYLFQEPTVFGNPGDTNIGIDAHSGGNMVMVNVSTYDLDVLLDVTNGGNSCAFSVLGGHLDGGVTKRTRLYRANGTHGKVRASFNDIGCNPNLLVPAAGTPFVSVASYQRVVLRNCNNMGSANGAVFKTDDSGGGDGGTVHLEFCEIPSTTAQVRDAASSGGKYRVLDCIDESSGAYIAAYGDLDTVNAATVAVADAAGDTTCWVLLAGSQTGNLPILSDAGLTYNANTNALTATTFVGALTGNVTGNVTGNLTGNVTGNASGSSGSCTGNAATSTKWAATITINGTAVDGSGNVTITAAAGTLTGTTLAAAVVTSSLTTVGTIGTGVWQGTKVGLAYGGTNADLSATGGTSQVLKQTSAGAAVTVAQLAAADLSDGTTGTVKVVMSTSPVLVTPTLGAALATTVNKVTLTTPATGSTLTIDDGFTLHATGNVTALSGSHTGTSSGTNTGDQTITLSGQVSGSGTGAITTTTADGFTRVKSASDELSTANGATTTSANVAFSVTANKRYKVRYYLIFDGDDAVKDAAFRFAVAAGTMQGFGTVSTLGTSLTQSHAAVTATGAANTGTTNVGTQGAAGNVTGADGHFEFVPSNTTTFAVQFGNAATGGANVHLMTGSLFEMEQLN